ncbi:MAG: EutN/CcmL family microcompartment protein [Tenuifilaceae bacterium]|jgi:ethanolamine utilization protein EutN|nr:EutN/CcmL family microcompartment protein [Tenuifilaceae bacterium]
MILGKVVGNVVSTVKAPGYDARKILVIQPIDPAGAPKGKTFLAIDTVQAGVGDTVITIDEGGSARMVIREPKTYTVKTVVVGIVDALLKE